MIKQLLSWPKEKVLKDKKRSTKHTYKTKDRVTRTPLKTGGELRCSGRVGRTMVFQALIKPMRWMDNTLLYQRKTNYKLCDAFIFNIFKRKL